jgi:hypothetical protein
LYYGYSPSGVSKFRLSSAVVSLLAASVATSSTKEESTNTESAAATLPEAGREHELQELTPIIRSRLARITNNFFILSKLHLIIDTIVIG